MAGICNVVNVKATYFGGGELYSVQNELEDMDNGSIYLLGERIEGNDDIFKVKKPTTNTTDKGTFLLIASPEINPYACNFTQNLIQNFTNKTGSIARAYALSVGDVFEVDLGQITALSDTPEVKKYVVLTDGEVKYKEANSVSNETFACQIDAIYPFDRPMQISAGKVEKPINLARLRVVKCTKQ